MPVLFAFFRLNDIQSPMPSESHPFLARVHCLQCLDHITNFNLQCTMHRPDHTFIPPHRFELQKESTRPVRRGSPAGSNSPPRTPPKRRAGKNTHGGARTHDHQVKSLTLYRLSYTGLRMPLSAVPDPVSGPIGTRFSVPIVHPLPERCLAGDGD